MKHRATVIIPTFGNAKFARWTIKSIQQQTIKDIEICIICDGSSENMVSFFQDMEREDSRIRVFAYPKSPGNGEPYRDIVIKQTTGDIICYCGHDDLWLPNHVEAMEQTLKTSYFTHSIHVEVNVPKYIKDENSLLENIIWIDLNKDIIRRMMGQENFFGLAFAAHTRDSYYELEEGWVTPQYDIWSDLYMWRKFLSSFETHCKTTVQVTALKFPQTPRKYWTEHQRDKELKTYYKKINNPRFLKQLNRNIINRIEWIDGFSYLERDKKNNWRWCSTQGTLILNNPLSLNKKSIISARFFTGYPDMTNLRIESALFNENLQINNSGYNYNKKITIPPGRHEVKFSCDAKQIDAPIDKRILVFCIRNFHMVTSSNITNNFD